MRLGNACLLTVVFAVSGCAVSHRESFVSPEAHAAANVPSAVQLASYVQEASRSPSDAPPPPEPLQEPVRQPMAESLDELEWQAVANNPTLLRLEQEALAARAKADYAAKLPDPKLGANVFGQPIETAAGSQRANLTVLQTLPWLARLDARSQQACLEALAAELHYETARLKLLGDLRASWHRLFVIEKQLETTRANQALLESLVKTATAVVGVGRASPSDVRIGTVELGRLQQQFVQLEQQRSSMRAELNRLLGRPAEAPVAAPQELSVELPKWTHGMLRQLAFDNQPAIAESHVRAEATRWGVEVARLQRRPDVTLSASWFEIDNNRPGTTLVDVGEDAWSLGAQISLPLWRADYDAIEREANWKHAASHASVDETRHRFDALLQDLLAQAQAADDTAKLYASTIVPDAKQTLTVDQQAYANGTVSFDRVLRDFRSVLTLQLEYHRAQGRLATAIARIRQATGVELVSDSAP